MARAESNHSTRSVGSFEDDAFSKNGFPFGQRYYGHASEVKHERLRASRICRNLMDSTPIERKWMRFGVRASGRRTNHL